MDILIPMYDTTGVYELKKGAKAFGGMTLNGQVAPASVKIVYYKFKINYSDEVGETTCEVVKNFEKEIITILSVSLHRTPAEEGGGNEVFVGAPVLDIMKVGDENFTATKGLSFTLSADHRSIYLYGNDTLETKGEIGLTLLVRETIRQ